MTFNDLRTEIMDRLNLTSTDAQTRIGRAINRKYRLITSTIGLEMSRRSTTTIVGAISGSTGVLSNAEKIVSIFDRNVSPYRKLDQVTLDEIEDLQPFTASNTPTMWAIQSQTSDTVTVIFDRIFQANTTFYCDAYLAISDLSGINEPAFPESYHDIIIEGVMADELRKMEKPQLAQLAQVEFQRILSDLRMWMAKSAMTLYQGKTASSSSRGSGGSGSGGSVNGALSYTQTGLITFDRDPSAPFAVTSGSAKVDNLDADKFDGLDSSAFIQVGSVSAVPTSPNDSSKFLNGASTPAFAQVTGSNLLLSDVTTNDVTSTKHGFAPKSPADATKFLNGAATPAYALVKDSDLSTSDITTNDVSTSKHGFTPKAPNTTYGFLRGDATWGRPGTRVQSVTSASTITANADTDDCVDVTAQAAAPTFAAPTGTPVNFQKLMIRIKDNGTARAITWNAAFVAGGVSLPTTTVISKILTIGFIYNTANSLNKWQCVAVAQEA